MEAELNGAAFGHLDLDSAVCMLQGGVSFGDVFPSVPSADRDALRRVFVTDPNCGPTPKSGVRKPIPRCNSLPPSGDPCRICGMGMVRSGKCLYCPNGCGSEGECS